MGSNLVKVSSHTLQWEVTKSGVWWGWAGFATECLTVSCLWYRTWSLRQPCLLTRSMQALWRSRRSHLLWQRKCWRLVYCVLPAQIKEPQVIETSGALHDGAPCDHVLVLAHKTISFIIPICCCYTIWLPLRLHQWTDFCCLLEWYCRIFECTYVKRQQFLIKLFVSRLLRAPHTLLGTSCAKYPASSMSSLEAAHAKPSLCATLAVPSYEL